MEFSWAEDCVPKTAKAKQLVKKVGELSRTFLCSSSGTLALPKDGLSITFVKADGSPALLTFDGSTSPSPAAVEGIKAAKPPLICDLDVYQLGNLAAPLVHGYSVKAELHKLSLKKAKDKFELVRGGEASSSTCVGTLVLVLPLPHTGGDVLVRPASGKSGELKFPVRTSGSSELTWVACLRPHGVDVGAIESGQQLTLWYNLHRLERATAKRKRDDPKKLLGDPKSSPLYWVLREIYEDDKFCPVAGCILGIPGTGDENWDDMIVQIAKAAGMGAKKVLVFSRDAGDPEMLLGEKDDIPDYSLDCTQPGLSSAKAVVWCRGLSSFRWEHETAGKYYNEYNYAKAAAVMVVVPCLDKRRANPGDDDDRLQHYGIILDDSDVWEEECTFEYAFHGDNVKEEEDEDESGEDEGEGNESKEDEDESREDEGEGDESKEDEDDE
ncbi:hypothetical protein SELMODRAFT_415543 [Selaginella moellendorffii]|uniref:Uncharacterized protein n=1 Tax=Selaginella moellendorffii TaxID=88036 RepID=D8RWG3_SELML|nr:hypothetical protein SELMODRAFT_415543 [Selaginella moellendorffii]